MAVELQLREPRAPVFGRSAMIVCGHSAGSLAGISVLKRGGNAVDAMIAASSALAVVLGHATSIGGDCFILFHEAASGRTLGLNASGVAPALATPERFPDGIKIHGPLAPVVPGLIRGWEAMHRRFGKLQWKDLFADAVALAEAAPVSQVLASRIPESRDFLAADPARQRSTSPMAGRSASARRCASPRSRRRSAKSPIRAPMASTAARSPSASAPISKRAAA